MQLRSRMLPLIPAMLMHGAAVRADDTPTFLHWYELRWKDMEHRTPDLFAAGYDAVWLPPASRTFATGSPGYDVFDRFNLGRPADETAYGTEQAFKAVVGELHAADTLVYLDIIMNHNSGRQASASFQAAGGYPGFWMQPANPPVNKQPTSPWGDFHAGNANGYLQSENPGGANYHLFNGDLLGLIDIDQTTNHQFIRHPVAPGNPQNIPAGTTTNLPDAANHRFYPDQALAPFAFVNPGTSRNPGATPFTIYPFNTAEPMEGDPVTDNTTGLLMRWTQWMMDEHRVDGFRLDAAKHIESWFWDRYWDSAVHQRRTTPWGAKVNPFTFGEVVESNQFTYANYVRKDAFANRDCLDLNGAGQLRNLVTANGFGAWSNALSAHLDNQDDGFNNGSLGLNHVFSHDNGSTGNGSSQPPLPTRRQQALAEHAYLLMRPGPAIVYHNARMLSRPGGFWPREGTPLALGLDPATNQPDPVLVRLTQTRNHYARGEFNALNNTDPVNQSQNDVLVFERRKSLGGGQFSANVLVGVNDRYDSGVQTRNVLTSFTSGTRLHEQTGNAADPQVDPGNVIPEVLIVGQDRRVQITIPNNVSSAGEHARGYVIYGPVLPAGSLTLTNVASTIAPDPPLFPAGRRRLTPVPVIAADSFEVRLTTTQADPLDPNTDDSALLRLDQGYTDLNANGSFDIPPTDPIAGGYENFLTERQPLFGSTQTQGTYRQAIDATALTEGYHYVSVLAFRHRSPAEDRLFREFRRPVYIDRQGPAVEWLEAGEPITTSTFLVRVRPLDRTANRVHFFWDLPVGATPIPDPFNLGSEHDRFEWRKTQPGLAHGFHSLTLLAFEDSGNSSITRYDNVFVDTCRADFNNDGNLTIADFGAFQAGFVQGNPEADFNNDGQLTIADFGAFQSAFVQGCS